MKKVFTILCLLLLCSGVLTAQTRIGYSNGAFNRTDGVRVGAGEKQGLAIKLPKEKIELLRGKKIVGVRTVFGTRNVENLKFFLTSNLDQQPLYEQPTDGATTNWKDFTFTTPYLIGNETELYVGYTLEASTTYRPLAFDKSNDIKGISWGYSDDNTWVDLYGNDFGCANIYLLIEDAKPFTDLCLKTFSVDGYYKAENAYQYSGQILNFGTNTINSFDITCQIGDNEPVIYPFTGKNIAANGTFDFKLPEYASHISGYLPVHISVTNINGADDMDMTDNVASDNMFIYPATMEKRLLLEGFTGQSCGNCPAGHRVTESVLERTQEPVIEVFHHAGYEPDIFTMVEDGEYCWFYNSDRNYAPALMVDRMLNPNLGTPGPIFQVSEQNLENTINIAAAQQPYVSIDINNEFNNETRELKAAVKVHTYVKPGSEVNTLNVFIVQDSIVSSQSSGGTNYMHRYAFRGALTSVWGQSIALEEGKEATYDFTYILPDKIKSTYQDKVSVKTNLKDMYLVAFVSAYSNNPNGCPVYNSNIAKFSNGSITGIKGAANEEAFQIYVDGNQLTINGDCSQLNVYDMSGKQIVTWNNVAEPLTLEDGFYIIRAICKGKVISRKIAVMK